MSKVMPRDEHGYINNRGTSIYWGVTTNTDPLGHSRWVVSYNDQAKDITHTLTPNQFTLTEADAARVSAYIFDQGCRSTRIHATDNILSADGKWVYYISRNTINRKQYTELVEVYKPKNIKLDEFEAEVIKEIEEISAKPRQRRSRVKAGESDVVAKLTKEILDARLSPKAARTLIAVLEANLK